MPEALKTFGPLGVAVYFFSVILTLAFSLPLGAESWFSWFVAPLGGIGGYGVASATRSSAKHWSWGKTILISAAIVIAGVLPAGLYIKMCNASPPAPSLRYLLGEAVLLALTFFSLGYVIGTARFKFASE